MNSSCLKLWIETTLILPVGSQPFLDLLTMIPLALFFFAFVSSKDFALVSKDFLLAAYWSRLNIKYLKFVCYLHFFKELRSPEEGRTQMFFKIRVLRNFSMFTGKHLCCSLFKIKLQALQHATLFKRDFNADVSLLILRDFYDQLFYRTPPISAFVSRQPWRQTIYLMVSSKNVYFQLKILKRFGKLW